ncbi:hypothetical protein CEE45_09690 [Candidatus Heimdallarchaeota archaeon B3_Heim]|nr:MAG: hypothetical protein CEE45_09690 [Candidatus Heimdallarchaeota archaeon B3_Heim]
MERETAKNLLVWGATILVAQNIVLIILIMMTFVLQDVSTIELVQTLSFWLDIIGFGLIGFGMLSIGIHYPSVGNYTQRGAYLAFGWAILSIIWRLIMGMLIPDFYLLGEPDIANLELYAILPPVLFGIAAVLLLLLMFSFNTTMTKFQELEGIGTGKSNLFSAYAIVHIVGAAMIVVGWVPIAKIILDPASTSIDDLGEAAGGLMLAGLGFIIKILAVPIMGIIAFLGVKNSFQTIE